MARRLYLSLVVVVLALLTAAAGLLASLETAWFAGLAGDIASRRLNRPVTLHGPLEIDWSTQPRVRLPGLTIANPDWAGPAPLLELEAASARIRLSALLRARVAIHDLTLQRPRLHMRRDAEGERSWDLLFPDAEGDAAFQIQVFDLLLRDGQLDYQDLHDATRLQARFETRPQADGPGEALWSQGRGVRDGQPFRFQLQGGHPRRLADPERAYPLSLRLETDDSLFQLRGELLAPLDAQGGDLALLAQGPSPDRLSAVLGADLPRLPRYRLEGQLRFQGDTWEMQVREARVGASDLSGRVRVELGERRRVEADLVAARLRVDDLRPGPEDGREGGGGAAGPAPSEVRGDLDFLRRFDGRLRFRGERVRGPGELELQRLDFVAQLQAGVLRVDQAQVSARGGQLTGRLELDANHSPVRGSLGVNAENVDLSAVLAAFGVGPRAYGAIHGWLDLRFAGLGLEAALDSASGELVLYMRGGKAETLLVELMGLELGEALLTALFGEEDTEIDCAFGRLDADNGLARISRLVVATGEADLTGAGRVDFRRDRLELVIQGHGRNLAVGNLSSPLRLSGPLDDIQVEVPAGELAARGALAAVAGVVAAPLAAIPTLGPPDTGDGKEDLCQRLLAAAAARNPRD